MTFPEFCWYTGVSKPCTLGGTYYRFCPQLCQLLFQISRVSVSPGVCTGIPSFLSCLFLMMPPSGVTDTPQNVDVPSPARREGKIRIRSTASSLQRRFTRFVTSRAWQPTGLPFFAPIITCHYMLGLQSQFMHSANEAQYSKKYYMKSHAQDTVAFHSITLSTGIDPLPVINS
jgi:hypothetical protein